MRKVLVPTDGSENAMRAVRYAAELAKENANHEVFLLHVVDPSDLIDDNHWKQTAIEKHTSEGQSKLAAAKQIFDQAGIRCHSDLVVGNARQEISAYARSKGCDAIIMGTRGASPIASLFIGSVAQRVIHTSDVPVTLVR